MESNTKSITKEEIEIRDKSFMKKSQGSDQKNNNSRSDTMSKPLKQSTLKMSSLPHIDENSPPHSDKDIKEPVISPHSNPSNIDVSVSINNDIMTENAKLKQSLSAAQAQVNQLKIENEKNSQLFQMFDQKMKEVQQVIE